MRTEGPLLSERLTHVLHMVQTGTGAADVGCDHGYIAIHLILSGRAERVIAMDVNSGPLKRAGQHIRKYGLAEQIETRLSDGMEALRDGEAESVICAGMGGKLVCGILERSLPLAKGMKQLILQPQSEIHIVRAWLREHDFAIAAEDMVFEDGKYYPMMRAVPVLQDSMRKAFVGQDSMCRGSMRQTSMRKDADGLEQHIRDRYGPCLLASAHPVLWQYLQKEHDTCENILRSLERASDAGETRRNELIHRLCEIELAESYLRGIHSGQTADAERSADEMR